MKRFFFFAITTLTLSFSLSAIVSTASATTPVVTPFPKNSNTAVVSTVAPILHIDSHELYDRLNLSSKINFDVFDMAIKGYLRINKRKEIITLVDFSKPSTQERLYVLDLKQEKILFASHVAHGRNSGQNFATSFSNKNGSYQSSLGFYLTEGTYQGKNGYSLILDGLEKGINDNAKSRAIVMHGANYANPSVIGGSGRLGRSLGCPALPPSINKPVIDAIKNGSVLFIYGNDDSYPKKSALLH
ncbi:MAG TPA: hypothetical protein DCF91_01455 [Porphyromonadaceae bacterium]|nr:hypothetical protein [Porphyromonadaceae bacterium]